MIRCPHRIAFLLRLTSRLEHSVRRDRAIWRNRHQARWVERLISEAAKLEVKRIRMSWRARCCQTHVD